MASKFPVFLVLGLCSAGVCTPAFAQPQPAASVVREEPLTLSVFSVSANQIGRYQTAEALSGGRVRVNLFEADATIQVLTSEFMEDLAGSRLIDAAKYIAGVSDSTLPAGIDRVTMRGFQTQGQTIDGFYYSGQSNYDDALVDRLEIVKGPNAILSPAGTPGGTISIVSKKPLFSPRTRISASLGQYSANGAVVDATGPLPFFGGQKLAYRVVSSVNDADGYLVNDRRKSFALMPSLTLRPWSGAEFTVIGEAYSYEAVASNGAPLDPSVGTASSSLAPFAGLPRDFNPANRDETRWERKRNVTAIFTTRLLAGLDLRVASRYLQSRYNPFALNTGISAPGGAIDPRSGFFVGGLTFATPAPHVSSPAVQPTRTITRAGTFQTRTQYLGDFKIDLAYERVFGPVKANTTAGYSHSKYKRNQQQSNVTRGTQSVDLPVYDLPVVFAARNQNQVFAISTDQVYAMQRLAVLDDRVLLSGSVAPIRTDGNFVNKLLVRTFDAKASTTDSSYGLVVKPIPSVALFYTYAEGSLGNQAIDQVAQNLAPAFSRGRQQEYGVRYRFLAGLATATLSRFDLRQDGQQIPNPGNLTVPPPPIPLPPLFLNRNSKGWEFNFTGRITRDLSLLGGWTSFRNRDPNGVPFAGVAERTLSGLLRYDFNRGSLRGMGLTLGAVQTGRRPGDTATGFTRASTPALLIPNQPTFYFPAYTSVDAGVYFKRGAWSVQVNARNALDESFWLAGTRTGVIPGNPRNLIISTAYQF